MGHATLIDGNDIRTGVTAIVHDGLLGGTLPAGLSVFNGYGKMTGATQVAELGQLETPVLLTSTLSVFRVADALLSYLHELPSRQGVATLNPVVAETNDGYLSDIWARPITSQHVYDALSGATAGPVAEGCVGAGTGTGALGFKAGVGTSSRVVECRAAEGAEPARVSVGALVQANFGGELTVAGVPVPAAGPQPGAGPAGGPASPGSPGQQGEPPGPGGSCVMVLATDAPLDARSLTRLASRSFAGMARTGSDFSGQSGDYALAFSTASELAAGDGEGNVPRQDLDLLFRAAIEATEEAILNSLFMAVTTRGYRGHVRHAVPLDRVRALVSGR